MNPNTESEHDLSILQNRSGDQSKESDVCTMALSFYEVSAIMCPRLIKIIFDLLIYSKDFTWNGKSDLPRASSHRLRGCA